MQNSLPVQKKCAHKYKVEQFFLEIPNSIFVANIEVMCFAFHD